MITKSAHLACSLALGVMLSSSCWAGISISPFSLGTLDAVVNFCTHVDPAGGRAYQRLSATLTDGVGDRALEQMRQSQVYGSAYSQFSAALSEGMPQSDARAACMQLASSDKGHDGRNDRDNHDSRDHHD